MKHYAIIINPAAGRGRASRVAGELAGAMDRRGLSYKLMRTSGPLDASALAASALGSADAVIAVGGDGTVNEVAQALAQTEMPMAVVPGGSGNDFVRSLVRFPKGPDKIARALEASSVREIDLGLIDGRYFVNAVGVGLDAAANIETLKFKKLKGLPAYLVAFLKALATFRPPMIEVSGEGLGIKSRALLLTLGNGKSCGGGFLLTPDAVLDDGLLDYSLVEPMFLPVLMWHFPKVFTGSIGKVKYSTTGRTRGLTIKSDANLPVHIDGEVYRSEGRDIVISLVPRALKILQPGPEDRD